MKPSTLGAGLLVAGCVTMTVGCYLWVPALGWIVGGFTLFGVGAHLREPDEVAVVEPPHMKAMDGEALLRAVEEAARLRSMRGGKPVHLA